MEHLLTENDRITAKEGGQGGLTEGQQAQLSRNDKTITGVRLQASAWFLLSLVFSPPVRMRLGDRLRGVDETPRRYTHCCVLPVFGEHGRKCKVVVVCAMRFGLAN